MSTATVTDHIDVEIQSIISEETNLTALVLQGVVALDRIPTGDLVAYRRISAAGSDAATNIKRFEGLFEAICARRHAHWKAATAARARIITPLEEVKAKASRLLGAFDQEAERLRRAEEARLQEESRRQAEKEAAENLALAQAESKRAAEELAIADAIALEAAGDKKGADAVLANPAPVPLYNMPPVYVPPVVVAKSTPKIEGKSSVTTWAWRVKQSPACHVLGMHKPEECSTCLADVPREYLILNTKLVGQITRAMKDKTNIDGVEVYPEGNARFRG